MAGHPSILPARPRRIRKRKGMRCCCPGDRGPATPGPACGELLEGDEVRGEAGPVLQARNQHLVQQLGLRPLLDGVLAHVHHDQAVLTRPLAQPRPACKRAARSPAAVRNVPAFDTGTQPAHPSSLIAR